MNKCSPWRLVAIVILATSLLLGPVGSSWAFLDELAGVYSQADVDVVIVAYRAHSAGGRLVVTRLFRVR